MSEKDFHGLNNGRNLGGVWMENIGDFWKIIEFFRGQVGVEHDELASWTTCSSEVLQQWFYIYTRIWEYRHACTLYFESPLAIFVKTRQTGRVATFLPHLFKNRSILGNSFRTWNPKWFSVNIFEEIQVIYGSGFLIPCTYTSPSKKWLHYEYVDVRTNKRSCRYGHCLSSINTMWCRRVVVSCDCHLKKSRGQVMLHHHLWSF